jgi:hypothetical protein
VVVHGRYAAPRGLSLNAEPEINRTTIGHSVISMGASVSQLGKFDILADF